MVYRIRLLRETMAIVRRTVRMVYRDSLALMVVLLATLEVPEAEVAMGAMQLPSLQ